jgi:hypothetical protein
VFIYLFIYLFSRFANYEQKKKDTQSAILNKRNANPKTALEKGTVLTPEQIAARFGNMTKKSVAGKYISFI